MFEGDVTEILDLGLRRLYKAISKKNEVLFWGCGIRIQCQSTMIRKSDQI